MPNVPTGKTKIQQSMYWEPADWRRIERASRVLERRHVGLEVSPLGFVRSATLRAVEEVEKEERKAS